METIAKKGRPPGVPAPNSKPNPVANRVVTGSIEQTGKVDEAKVNDVATDIATKVGKPGDPKPNSKPLPVVNQHVTGSIDASKKEADAAPRK